ncbi:MAG TPA: (d)CMP kinase, partial [Bacteroidota bacterium]
MAQDRGNLSLMKDCVPLQWCYDPGWYSRWKHGRIPRLPPKRKFAILTVHIAVKSKNLVIAIDGPAASGKSTTARLVARRLGYLHIDTGAMYRALTLRILRENVSVDDEPKVSRLAEQTNIVLRRTEDGNRVLLMGEDVTEEIRKPQVTKHVSTVSSYRNVRAVLVKKQRSLAREGGVVLEGRDIGTVVLPDADLKIFMVANVAERARRRKRDLHEAGVHVDEETLTQEILDRDEKDSTRTTSPLKRAEDAVEVDTSTLTIEE